MEERKRAILLQTEATNHKLDTLKDFLRKVRECSNWLLSVRSDGESNTSLQNRLLDSVQESYGFNVQVCCSLFRSLPAKCKRGRISGVTVKFNVPRNCKTCVTKNFFFVELGLYPRHRVAIPIRYNRNFVRFQNLLKSGWICKTFGLTPRLEIVAYLSIIVVNPANNIELRNILAIDINAKDFSYTIMGTDGNILKQGYLGQQIWQQKHRFAERRAILQHFGALKKLKLMGHRERNYVETNLGQLVREIVLLARQFNVSDIAIENLRRFKPKGRTFNKRVLSIPFYKFKMVLENRCFDSEIRLNKVDAYHTSKWCIRCGAVAKKGHDVSNYSLFRCKECGLVMNSDRKASLAVAAKSLLERKPECEWIQISGRRVPVNGLIRHNVSNAAQPLTVPVLIERRGKLMGSRREQFTKSY